MEFSLPSSLTAIVNMRFHYDEKQRKLVGEAEIKLLGELLGRVAKLGSELQELLVTFADHMSSSRMSR